MAIGGDTERQRHRVRVGTVVIDAVDLQEAAAFWSAALDTPILTGDPARDRHVSLGQAAGGLRLLLRRVPSATATRTPCTWTWRPTTRRPR